MPPGDSGVAGRGEGTIAGLPPFIANGDFEQGLVGWTVLGGSAFNGQPIEANTINARDVLIDDKPPVDLGGDFWHTSSYPIGQNLAHLVRSVGDGSGVLESDKFSVSLPVLAYRIGGAVQPGVYLELRVPAQTAAAQPEYPALDAPDQDGFVAVRRDGPKGTDVLHEFFWELGGEYRRAGVLGSPAKIRLVIGGKGLHRLLVDDIRLLPEPPPPFHPPVWGWADLHCHPMAQAGFGGLLAGHMHGPVEDLGSCVREHGINHGNPALHLAPFFVGGSSNDGSLTTPGWTVGKPAVGEQMGFSGWPVFDDLSHIKVHQDWVHRAYQGGQRLMVALIVHSELLATLNGAPQSDRDTVEPQIQMLIEFVAHNRAWCGLAKTPTEARTLIEANKLAFVLGLETDSINGWVHESDFTSVPAECHTKLHGYFAYLQSLGVVQINLLHLSDNAFGGMAVYDYMFWINTWSRIQRGPDTEDGFVNHPVADRISRKVSTPSAVWGHIDELAFEKGFPAPSTFAGPWTPNGHANKRGLTVAGQAAVLEAMRLGMVIDLDHMSEHSADQAFAVATTQPNQSMPYPLVSAHNGAREMAPRAADPSLPLPMGSDSRRGSHGYPNENMKSAKQLGFIRQTMGMFGHGTAGADSRDFPQPPMGTATRLPVDNDCPGSDKTFAQGYQFVHKTLGTPVALGTDWNSLLAGPGPRFGPRAASGLAAEVTSAAPAHQLSVRNERRADVLAQSGGVMYKTPLRDWRKFRFEAPALYEGLFPQTPLQDKVHHLWQVMAIREVGISIEVAEALEPLDEIVREVLIGIGGGLAAAVPAPSPLAAEYRRAGMLMNQANANLTPGAESELVINLVTALREISGVWMAMSTGQRVPQTVKLERSTAGPQRDFDYNLDGLAHYGMLPDMFQDLKNVGLPAPALTGLFGSAEEYLKVWQRSVDIGATLPH